MERVKEFSWRERMDPDAISFCFSVCELHAERWPTGPGGFWPTAATQFNANFFEKYSSIYKKSYHGANFTWTLPDDGE